MIEIAPSILSADFARLGEQVRDALDCGMRRIHVDVMDGHFVPNLSMGPHVVKCLKPIVAGAGALLETHLMIENPEQYVPAFIKAGSDLVTVHVEACANLYSVFQLIRNSGAKVGVTLKPNTSLVMLEDALADVDLVLVMTVEPGFGGQDLIPETLDKIVELKQMLADMDLADKVPIEVDGGIHAGTIAMAARAGATIAVCGSAVFNREASVRENIEGLRRAAGGI